MIIAVNEVIVHVENMGDYFEGKVLMSDHHYPNFRAKTIAELAKKAEVIIAGIQQGIAEIESKKKIRAKKTIAKEDL